MTVKYFGKIAELVLLQEEEWSGSEISVAEFKVLLIAKYPQLKAETIQIAVNLQLADDQTTIFKGSEVAIMPPFSGG